MSKPVNVIINGIIYYVQGVTHSANKGAKLRLADAAGKVLRLCHCPPLGVQGATVAGERLAYVW